MDVTAAEVKASRWTPPTRVALAVAGVLFLAGLALALVPSEATLDRAGTTQQISCGRPLSWLRAEDRGPALRRFLNGKAPPSQSTGPPPTAAIERLQQVLVGADRYHACHPPASVRLGFAGLLFVGGSLPLALRRWRKPAPPPEPGGADAAFLSRFGYQPALDGLRAVAIAWVITTHLGLKGFFVTGDHGVDLFFVLSGFLITTLLLRESADTGGISLRQFYVRRALRLLPVVLLMVVVGAAVHILGPDWYRSPRWTGLFGMLFYVSNWVHIRDVNALGFLTPTWSLAIEEQFYLLWPPIVAAMLAWGKGRKQVGLAAAYGAVAAALYRLTTTAGWTEAKYPWWYYNSLNRADSLLVGCLLATVLSPPVVAYLRRSPQLVIRVACVGVAGVALVCLKQTLSHSEGFLPAWGLVVLELSFALIVCALVLLPTSRMASVLSARWLVWLGRRSYGLYVIHLAIFTAIEQNHVTDVRYLRMFIEVSLSLVAAALSYRFIEAPALRLKKRFGGKPI